MAKTTRFRHRLKRDVLIVLLSILTAIVLRESGFLSSAFLISGESEFIGAFIAGVLFTSLFTTPVAVALFVTLSPAINLFAMALIGAAGAVLGDLAIFGLVRYTFREDVDYVMSVPRYKRFFAIFHRRMFRWIIPFVGALIIASPLPDELGIGLMGLSRLDTKKLIGISFTMNALGIALIGWFA